MPRGKQRQLTAGERMQYIASFERTLAAQGYTLETAASRMGYKAETLRLYLGRYGEARQPSLEFMRRAQERFGVPLPAAISLRPVAAAPRRPPSDSVRLSALLEFLARAGLATEDQICRLLDVDQSTANRFLRRLTSTRVLGRVRRSLTDEPGANANAFVYGLGPEGLAASARLLGRTPRPLIVGQRLQGRVLLDHNLGVAESALRLQLAYRDRLSDWLTDPDTRAEFKPGLGKTLWAEPDALFFWDVPAGRTARWLEWESGTVRAGRVQDKARAADQFYRSGEFTRRWGTERLAVVWIAPDDRHARRLRQWIGPLHTRLRHLFSDWERMQGEPMDGAIWLALNSGEARCTLISAALRREEDSHGITA